MPNGIAEPLVQCVIYNVMLSFQRSNCEGESYSPEISLDRYGKAASFENMHFEVTLSWDKVEVVTGYPSPSNAYRKKAFTCNLGRSDNTR